jgi:hypothetical protein
MPLLEFHHRHDHYFHPSEGTASVLASIAALSASLEDLKGNLMATIDNLRTEVQENTNATQAAITLLNGLKQRLDEAIASGDMTQVQALSDELSGNTDALAAAVAANTPADPNA